MGIAPDAIQLEINILTANASFPADRLDKFPMVETMEVTVKDKSGDLIAQVAGGNFSSYLRDRDFNLVLPRIKAGNATAQEASSFGNLHGATVEMMNQGVWPGGVFTSPLHIAISVSGSKNYVRDAAAPSSGPVAATYRLEGDGPPSLTDAYFAKMGLDVQYVLPRGAKAPLALYGDASLSNDQTAALLGVMDVLQRIYRPEIYLNNSPPGKVVSPRLDNTDFSRLNIFYDKVERDQLGAAQARKADAFMDKNKAALEMIETYFSRAARSPRPGATRPSPPPDR